MKTSDAETLKAVCFAVLMQGNSGIMTKSPEYVLEKYRTSSDVFPAYVMLDAGNRQRVKEWAKEWRFPIDDIFKELHL